MSARLCPQTNIDECYELGPFDKCNGGAMDVWCAVVCVVMDYRSIWWWCDGYTDIMVVVMRCTELRECCGVVVLEVVMLVR